MLHSAVNLIRQGTEFDVGEQYQGVAHGLEVEFIECHEDGRKLLRIILPGEDGLLGEGDIDPDLSFQYEDVDGSMARWN